MNLETVNTQIRHFQAAKDLPTMGKHSWQLACTLAESPPKELTTEISSMSRVPWIWPMLSFARRMLRQKSMEYVADLEQQVHLANALLNEPDLILPDFRYKCEIAVFDAMHRLDQIAVVQEYLKNFFAPSDLIVVKWKPTLESLAWLPADYAQQHLELAEPHVLAALRIHCPWWAVIAQHGRTTETL